MKIAIPLTSGTLSEHFGHCEQFAVYEINDSDRSVESSELLTPPPHEPGVFPAWLAGLGVNLVVAGGMGRRALDLFAENGIEVHSGLAGESAEKVMEAFMKDTLSHEAPLCNHDHDGEHTHTNCD